MAAVALEDVIKKVKPDINDQLSTIYSKVIGKKLIKIPTYNTVTCDDI